jgi:hypothetical protein
VDLIFDAVADERAVDVGAGGSFVDPVLSGRSSCMADDRDSAGNHKLVWTAEMAFQRRFEIIG